ncbi:MAG: response regulator [Candidatus Dojkabacteria bacterium]|nr:response regulator [Candidatus Dojkabacteria bacterium]
MAVPKKILIIEDEKPLMEAVEAKLKRLGMKVITSQSVQEAFTKLKNETSLDLVWLDHYLLGEETGIVFMQKIHEIEKFRDVPVILVSNTASEDKVETYKKLGVRKCYVKSGVRLDSIIEDIKEITKLRLAN